MTSEAAARRPLRGLYAITPRTEDTPDLLARARACVDAGAAVLQYRPKDLRPGLALTQARELALICRAGDTLFIVNDSPTLALTVGADGVHLGRDDDSPRSARIAMPGAIIGVSCYDDPARARAAAIAGADYVGIGSVFASSTKPRAVRAAMETLAAARAASGLPVVAIGGITLENAARAIAAGADMVAVISALFETDDTAAAARGFVRLFDDFPAGASHVRAQSRAL